MTGLSNFADINQTIRERIEDLIIETYEATKKQCLSKEDIREILHFEGTRSEAMSRLNISSNQWKFVHRNYDPETCKLNYRNDDTIYFK